MRFNYAKRTVIFVAGAGIILLAIISHSFSKPRPLAVSEVPIAFWAWRNAAPSEAEINKVFAATKAQTLFLRAGQFDLANKALQRIRPVSGTLPTAVELHLVYNGTRQFLRGWEQLEASALSAIVADTFRADLVRANNDHARVVGLQLDFDAPTRLLPQYAQMLRRLHELLPPNTKLSITGLPTWADLPDIKAVLAAVDFWIPQCYGAVIPTHISQSIPISSPAEVAKTIGKVRQLKKPFYAGLSAYGYAILYARDGSLMELRGDLDPALAAHSSALELVESREFSALRSPVSERRYVYRAKTETVLDGLIMQAGEALVFDIPNAETLREAARAVRDNAGESLLGICVFRLPTDNDETTLSLGEITAAVTDTRTEVATEITAHATGQHLEIVATNKGTASALFSEDALTIDVAVPPGSVSGVASLTGFTAYETYCYLPGASAPQPCSQRRTNLIRLKARSWKPATILKITLSLNQAPPESLAMLVATRVNDGRGAKEELSTKVHNTGE